MSSPAKAKRITSRNSAFLGLPVELRDMVYTEIVMTSGLSFEVDASPQRESSTWRIHPSTTIGCLSLVNAQIYHEVQAQIARHSANHNISFRFEITHHALLLPRLLPRCLPLERIRICNITVPCHGPRTHSGLIKECETLLELIYRMSEVEQLGVRLDMPETWKNQPTVDLESIPTDKCPRMTFEPWLAPSIVRDILFDWSIDYSKDKNTGHRPPQEELVDHDWPKSLREYVIWVGDKCVLHRHKLIDQVTGKRQWELTRDDGGSEFLEYTTEESMHWDSEELNGYYGGRSSALLRKVLGSACSSTSNAIGRAKPALGKP